MHHSKDKAQIHHPILQTVPCQEMMLTWEQLRAELLVVVDHGLAAFLDGFFCPHAQPFKQQVDVFVQGADGTKGNQWLLSVCDKTQRSLW